MVPGPGIAVCCAGLWVYQMSIMDSHAHCDLPAHFIGKDGMQVPQRKPQNEFGPMSFADVCLLSAPASCYFFAVLLNGCDLGTF